jgi:hypothetical protein
MAFQLNALMADILAEGTEEVRLFWECVKLRDRLNKKICRFGHEIFVSRCSHGHREIK